MVMPEDGGMDSKMSCSKCIFFNPDVLGCMITDFQRKNIKVDGKKLPCISNDITDKPVESKIIYSNDITDKPIESNINYKIIKEYCI